MARRNKHLEEAEAYDQAAAEAEARGDYTAVDLFQHMAVGERVKADRASRNEGRRSQRG